MHSHRSLLLVLAVSLLTPSSGSANPYVVHLGQAKATVEEQLAPYRPLGLVSLGELQNLPGVVMVEMPPATARVMESQGFEIEPLPERHLLQDEPSVPWNLDLENQRALPLDGNAFRPYTGKGVRIFIVDGETYRNPDEFGDRLVEAIDYIHDSKGPFTDCGFGDSGGPHATCMGSLAAGNVYGVAPGAELAMKRIFDCSGTYYGTAEFTALDDIATWKKANPGRPAIVNMSYTGLGQSPTEHKLLQVLDHLGVILVDSAGNQNIDACLNSPAGDSETITASASTEDDHKASWAARGTCVDLFAPGEHVPQRCGSGTLEWWGTGTSSSAPAIAGEIALMLEQIPDLTSAEARKLLLANATAGALQGDLGKGSPNRLLYTGPVKENVSRLSVLWNAGKRQFTVQATISVNGKPTPLSPIRLYRGAAVNGVCQGQPFATVSLVNGSGTATITGFKQAPKVLCLQSRSGLVYDRAIGNL